MKKQELVFRFHNPNSEKDTYNALVKIFTDAGCKRLIEAISQKEAEINDNKMEE